FGSLIKKAVTISHINQCHAQIIQSGLSGDCIIVTGIIQKLLDFKAATQAKRLFAGFRSPDLFLYNALIKGLKDDPLDSLNAYTALLRVTPFKPDNFTFSSIVAAFAGFPSPGMEKLGRLIHGHAVISGFGSEVFVGSALVDMYMSFSWIRHARKVFDGIPEPDTVLWNTMLSGLVKNSYFDDAIHVFHDMVLSNVGFDSTTLAVVLSCLAELRQVSSGMMVLALALKFGCDFNDHLITGLVKLYSKCGDISKARSMFGLFINPDLVAYNAMISGLSCNNETESAVHLFHGLLSSGCRVSSSTIVGLIPTCHPYGHLELTQSIHGFCMKSCFVSHCSVSTALMSVYSRLNELNLARQIFDESSAKKNLASWNAMISGYAQNGQTEMAVSLFREMQKLDIHPNPVTISSILSACAQLGMLSLGKWVHDLAKSENFESNIFVSTALIDMYAKCGSIEEARIFFDAMKEKNVVTWNAMISAYGLHGCGNEALRLYDDMAISGISPTGVTFLSILHACSHAGLVEEGERIFSSMVDDHGFEPTSEHYACLVDIFGRAGKLQKAFNFINNMPIVPGPGEWGALLGACMIHKDIDIAHVASRKLIALDHESAGHHVLLSNLYSISQSYPQAASLRETIKKKNLMKTPGCSLIEVKGHTHVFKSNDLSHPQLQSIYSELEMLVWKMKDSGYIVETLTALHDVEDEEKELTVKVHSEKLAIAFGILMSGEKEDIRIIKNLRVCLDCHNFTKFVSKITERAIIVRDANRFHHFRNGACSCRDYW
ncbi:hypothetical protein M569_14020, partial [Genlisea aurea]